VTADPHELTSDLIDVGRELRDVLALLESAGQAEASARAEYKRRYLTARAEARAADPKLRVGDLEEIAGLAAWEAWSSMIAAESWSRVLREKAHSLRQILSAHQSRHRVEAAYGGVG